MNWIPWVDLDTLTSTWFDWIGFVPLGVHLYALVLRRPDARWSPNPPMKRRKRPARALAVEGVWGAPQTHTSAMWFNTDETKCIFARARARANINSINWTNSWDSQFNNTLYYVKLNQCNHLIRFVPLGVHLSALVLRRPDARWSPNPPMKPRKRPARALTVEGVGGHHKHTRAPFDSTPTKQNATLPGPGPGPTSIQSIEPIHEIPNLIIRFII